MSHQEPIPSERQPQSAGDLEARTPDPEFVPKAKRRQFTAEYKLHILEEADHCTERGQIGELLRREGLYSSHLCTWRQQQAQGQLEALAPKKRGRKPDPSATELARLRRENERMRTQLGQAQIIIEVQKKLSRLLGLTTDKSEL